MTKKLTVKDVLRIRKEYREGNYNIAQFVKEFPTFRMEYHKIIRGEGKYKEIAETEDKFLTQQKEQTLLTSDRAIAVLNFKMECLTEAKEGKFSTLGLGTLYCLYVGWSYMNGMIDPGTKRQFASTMVSLGVEKAPQKWCAITRAQGVGFLRVAFCPYKAELRDRIYTYLEDTFPRYTEEQQRVIEKILANKESTEAIAKAAMTNQVCD